MRITPQVLTVKIDGTEFISFVAANAAVGHTADPVPLKPHCVTVSLANVATKMRWVFDHPVFSAATVH